MERQSLCDDREQYVAGDRVLAHPSDSHIGWAAALINIEFNPVILSFSAYNGAV